MFYIKQIKISLQSSEGSPPFSVATSLWMLQGPL